MRYVLGKGDWQTASQGESKCFLLANGLGGYSSQTVIGSNARNDHAAFISAKVAPSDRWTMVSRFDEVLYVNGKAFDLTSQSYVTKTQDQHGFIYLNRFVMDGMPEWEYMAEGVRVIKKMMMPYGINSLVVTYEIESCEGQEAYLSVTPVYGMHPKNDRPMAADHFCCTANAEGSYVISANDEMLYLKTDGKFTVKESKFIAGYYFEQDSVDGRDAYGSGMVLHSIVSSVVKDEERAMLTLVYSTDEDWLERTEEAGTLYLFACEQYIEELDRLSAIEENSLLHSAAGRQLAVSAAAYLTERESTGGMSIMAGFPFFGDWGRDTMIAFYGCTVSIGEDHSAKSILRTFMKYCRKGIMPNLFPEGNQEPMYNTVDASLLFINAAWEFLQRYPDKEFAAEVLPVVESIVCWYANGTDYNIHMDSDGLLAAGSGQWQLTWMDVRFEDILPTPRHGKPVEINAYWYNAVMVLKELISGADKPESQEDTPELIPGWKQMNAAAKTEYLDELAAKIKKSFLEKFTRPDGTLYDVLIESNDPREMAAQAQVRCNQVFALTMPFAMPEPEQARTILAQIRSKLYTPVGLRSLSPDDEQFHPNYGGAQFSRDMAYHQGTVWTYPLGSYYRACLRYAKQPVREAERIMAQLDGIEAAMAEGCLGHLPEIYDGEIPGASKGCFAQAWSVAELLRVYQEVEAVLK